MSQRKAGSVAKTLKFIGRSDYFVAGVPQSDLKVVDAPQAVDEISAERVAELVATGLYVEPKNEAIQEQEAV